MIRFIDLSDQIIEGLTEFAFYDTVNDEFCSFSGNSTWESINEFKESYDGNDLLRFLTLIPDSWNSSELINGELEFEFKNGNSIVLEVLKSPRGLRSEGERPHRVRLKLTGLLGKTNFVQLVNWLVNVSTTFN